MNHLFNYSTYIYDINQYGTHPVINFDEEIHGQFNAHCSGWCLGEGESWSSTFAIAIFHVVASPEVSLGNGRLRITCNVIEMVKGNNCPPFWQNNIVGGPVQSSLYDPSATPSLVLSGYTQQWWTEGEHVFISRPRDALYWQNNFYFGISANPSDPTDSVTIHITKLEWVDNNDVVTLLWTPENEALPPIPPYCLLAHVIPNTQVNLTWANAQSYTGLRAERSASKDGPWTDLELELEPDAESATDADPPSYDLWYRIVAINTAGETPSEPAEADAAIRARWNAVAHAMGIPDLAEPVAPFTYGEAGEQLFLVCCRLWRLEIAPDLPDPVESEPEDWREFLETGTFPTP